MKILLVQTSFLGDTVLSTPVIAALRQCYPQAELWMMTTPLARQLVERDPFLRGVITFDKRGAEAGVGGLQRKAAELRAHNFDKVYSLHKSARTSLLLWLAKIPVRIGFESAKLAFLYHFRLRRDRGRHDVLRNLSILAAEQQVESLPDELRLFPPEGETLSAAVREILDGPGYVVLVPGSAWKTKMWRWQGYREVAKHFLREGLRVVVAGGPDEIEVAAKVSDGLEVSNLGGRTSIAELLSIVQSARLVICNDSMALHVASAFKRPTVAIFCATSPAFGFGPWKSPARVVEAEGLSCKPCRRHGGQVCPTRTEACMTNVSPAQVIAAAREVLAS